MNERTTTGPDPTGAAEAMAWEPVDEAEVDADRDDEEPAEFLSPIWD